MQWRGYNIPEGTGLVFNTWAIHQDPQTYPEPDRFMPERWDGKVEMAAENALGAASDLFTFGAGRRICPGQHLAERSIFIVISHWLWAFDIAKARDPSGNEIPIDTKAIKPGLSRKFYPFEVSIKPRSKARDDVIRESWHKTKEEFLTADEQWKSIPKEVSQVVEKAKASRRGN